MRLYLSILAAIISLSALAQKPAKKFFGNNYEMYHKAYLVIDTNSKSALENSFFAYYSHCKDYIDGKELTASHAFNEEIDTLLGRFFFVDRITGRKDFVPNNNFRESPILFVLIDTATNRNYYFIYDKYDESKFAFLATPPKQEDLPPAKTATVSSPIYKEPSPIHLSGNYEQDMLILSQQIDAANQTNYQLKTGLEKYRRSQVSGYTLMILGTVAGSLPLLIQPENVKTTQAFAGVGLGLNVVGLITLISGHKHLRIEQQNY